MTYTRKEIDAWDEYLLGKDCPVHPNAKIKQGKYGLWCGIKTENGWCNGGWPTEEWINNYRKENNGQN